MLAIRKCLDCGRTIVSSQSLCKDCGEDFLAEEEYKQRHPVIQRKLAKLCLDCDVIFDARVCPSCNSAASVPVARYLKGG